ncbi:hypothetical protein KKA33_01705 [Patescibacteria group bacterium]|nr:hypothetical protein [Patescibacteria group bacterium]
MVTQPKHPAAEQDKHAVVQGMETIEEILSREHTIEEVEQALQKYVDNLDRVGFLEEAEKTQIVLAREKATMLLKNPDQYQLRGGQRKKIRRGLKKAEQQLKTAEDEDKALEELNALLNEPDEQPAPEPLNEQEFGEVVQAMDVKELQSLIADLTGKKKEIEKERATIEAGLALAQKTLEQKIGVPKTQTFPDILEAYVKDKPEAKKLYIKIARLQGLDATGSEEISILQKQLKTIIDVYGKLNPAQLKNEAILQGFMDKIKRIEPRIDDVLSKQDETSATQEPPTPPSPPPSAFAAPPPSMGKPENEPKKETTPSDDTAEAESDAVETRRGASQEEEKPAKEEQPTPETATATPEKTINKPVRDLLESILAKKELVSDDDPVCLAINALVNRKSIDLEKLKNFLQNPEFLRKNIDEKKVKDEMEKQKVSDYEGLLQKLEDESEQNKNFLESIKGQMRLSQDEIEKRTKALERISEIKQLIRETGNIIKLKGRTMVYDSPRHVLALVNFYLHRNDADMPIEALGSEIERQVNEQKEALYSGTRATINRFGFFLRPTLKTTLKALAKDREFARLGEKPADELAKLTGIFENSPDKVKQWIENLPGGFEKHIKTTIPRLIAYLELAIRDGNVSRLFKTGRARDLVRHLKNIQQEHIRAGVEEEFKRNPNMNNQGKMLLYLQKLNQSTRHTVDINKKILSRNVFKSVSLKGVAGAGLGAAAIFSPLPFLATLPAFLAAPTFAASYTHRIPKKHRPAVQKAALRAVVANGLAIGGVALGTLFTGGIALPFALGAIGAGAGAMSPEIGKKIWKEKQKIGKGGVSVAKKVPGASLAAAKGGGKLLKWTVGLPVVGVWRGTMWTLGKIFK